VGANRHPSDQHDPDGLNILVREQGTTTAIELRGEWDLAAVPSINEAISGVLDAVPQCVVLDLSRLGFIDSSGLHAAIELARRSAAQNTRLVIIPAPGPVQRTFEITALLARLPFIDKRPNSASVARLHPAESGSARPGAFSPPTSGTGSPP
jgi:anti-anti-sigma factor